MQQRWVRVTWIAFGWLAGCTSAWNDGARPPYTAAETNRALAPGSNLKARCYDGSLSRRQQRAVRLEFILYVDEHGAVRSAPVVGDPRDPRLVECMRSGLDTLRFPPKRAAEQLHLDFDMAP
jgi:hypothetical protein